MGLPLGTWHGPALCVDLGVFIRVLAWACPGGIGMGLPHMKLGDKHLDSGYRHGPALGDVAWACPA